MNTKYIKKLEHRLKTIRQDKISEQAYELVDEDEKSKEQIMEEHEEYIANIENDDDRQWEAWYARGYEVALFDLIQELKNTIEIKSITINWIKKWN